MPVLRRRMSALFKGVFGTFPNMSRTFCTRTQLFQQTAPAYQQHSMTEDAVKSNRTRPFLEMAGGLILMKKQMEVTGYVFCPGTIIKKCLMLFGASTEDLDLIECGEIHRTVSPDPESSMTHRQISFHRMLIEPKGYGQTQKNQVMDATSEVEEQLTMTGQMDISNHFQFVGSECKAVTEISEREIASDKRDGAKLYFKRSGYREWPLPPVSYAKSSIPLAMAKFMAHLNPTQHQPQSNIQHDHPITINDQLLIRTYRMPETDDSYSPTPEGIHQDGTEISGVTLIGLNGVESGGETRMWNIEAHTGNYNEDEFNDSSTAKNNLLFNHSLRNPWDTLLFNDRKVKHEARAFDGLRPCYRDVIVNFMRKPLKSGMDKRVITIESI